MNRLTRPDVSVDPTAARLIGPEVKIQGISDKFLHLILNGPTLHSVPKDTLRHLLRQLYDQLKTREDMEAAQEDPQPLTIDELKQMHGEPVWLADAKRWGIIDIEECGKWEGVPFVYFSDRGTSYVLNIEKRNIRCLRHKPKEV